MVMKSNNFKHTVLGIIPNDWEIKEFQDVMTGFFSGATPYRGRPDYYKGEIKWITSGELNYNIITDTNEKVNEEAVRNTNLKILPVGTFLFAITGLEAEGTRGSCAFTGVESTTNQSCMALFPKETLDNSYLYHFYVWQGKKLAIKYCQGTKQQSYTAKIVRTLPIILPPTKSEQTAIATALSDVDAQIENLERLIEKKRNIKKGKMQELLTPKNEWVLQTLGCCFQLSSGKSKSKYIEEGGQFIVMDMGSVSSDGQLIKTKRTNFGIDFLDYGDLVMPKDDIGGGKIIGKVGFIDSKEKYVLGDHVYKLKAIHSGIDTLFLYYLINSHVVNKALKQKVTGSAQLGLSKKSVEEQEVELPPSRALQSKIAELLYDVDAEILHLEHKVSKLKLIKQGMMQALLTGKIRLT